MNKGYYRIVEKHNELGGLLTHRDDLYKSDFRTLLSWTGTFGWVLCNHGTLLMTSTLNDNLTRRYIFGCPAFGQFTFNESFGEELGVIAMFFWNGISLEKMNSEQDLKRALKQTPEIYLRTFGKEAL